MGWSGLSKGCNFTTSAKGVQAITAFEVPDTSNREFGGVKVRFRDLFEEAPDTGIAMKIRIGSLTFLIAEAQKQMKGKASESQSSDSCRR